MFRRLFLTTPLAFIGTTISKALPIVSPATQTSEDISVYFYSVDRCQLWFLSFEIDGQCFGTHYSWEYQRDLLEVYDLSIEYIIKRFIFEATGKKCNFVDKQGPLPEYKLIGIYLNRKYINKFSKRYDNTIRPAASSISVMTEKHIVSWNLPTPTTQCDFRKITRKPNT